MYCVLYKIWAFSMRAIKLWNRTISFFFHRILNIWYLCFCPSLTSDNSTRFNINRIRLQFPYTLCDCVNPKNPYRTDTVKNTKQNGTTKFADSANEPNEGFTFDNLLAVCIICVNLFRRHSLRHHWNDDIQIIIITILFFFKYRQKIFLQSIDQ